MKWILFTGTWKLTNKEIEEDVRKAARSVIERGDGVLTGGATGVDYFAMDEVLKLDPSVSRLRVIIPARLDSYIHDYFTNWCHEPITKKDIDELAALLKKIKKVNPTALLEMPYETITQEHYNLRHDQEVMYSDEVYAFQVNDSTGTQDTIDKSAKAGLPISNHKKYKI
ncbi:MAG: hypothetical protein Q7S11_01625 [bacterium]|nr:hypothetical protein [bacterium]